MKGGLFAVLVVALLGAAHTLAYVDTAAWPLQLVAVAVLAGFVCRATPGRAALLGFAFGSAWLVAGTWWLFISMHRYGGMPAWMAALAVLALASLLSLYLAAAMALVARCMPRRPAGRRVAAGVRRLGGAAVFAAAWLAAELARGVFFTGFPWVASGYAHIDSPLAGYAPWLGVYGIGAVAAFAAAAIGCADLKSARGWLAPSAALAGALLLGAVAAGVDFTRPTSTVSVTLLQGNIPQDEKFESRYIGEALALLEAQLERATGELVVGPETVIPLLPSQLDSGWWTRALGRFADGRRAALLGLPLGSVEAGYTNSAAGISVESASAPGGFYRYDKHHLVPFGEFIPTGFRWFTEQMRIPLGDFARGSVAQPSFAFRGERIAPNICYEDLFGEELAARFARAEEAPTVLANLSNIGWFGDTIAVAQHLQISRLRTLELQRPMLRATNTGATAVIDHRGVVTAELAPFTRGALDANVEGRTGTTPFAAWASRLGLWPLAIVAFAVLVIAWLTRPRTLVGLQNAPPA